MVENIVLQVTGPPSRAKEAWESNFEVRIWLHHFLAVRNPEHVI